MSSKAEDMTDDEVLYKKGKAKIKKIVSKLKASDFNEFDQKTLIDEVDFDILRPMLLESSKMQDITMELLMDYQFLTVLQKIFERQQKDSKYWSGNAHLLTRLLRSVLYWGSESLGKMFLDVDFPKILVDNLSEEHLMNLTSKETVDQVFELVCCCYLAMKLNPNSRLEFRNRDLVKLCTHFMQKAGNDRKLTNELLFVLSYVADLDADPKALKATNKNLDYIHDRLKLTLKNDDHRSEIGFSAAEILACISRLALSSDNAMFLIGHGIINTCESIISDGFKDDEIQIALEFLWTLSFQQCGAREIKKNKYLCGLINSHKSSDNKHISDAATGILFQLNVDEELSQKLVGFKTQKSDGQQDEGRHIMISYTWNQSEIARALAERLRLEDGCRNVWLDIEKMEGNILERMAEGVEGASVVVCCYSESYKNSQACRSEAEYAFKLNKHIIYINTQADYEANGWIGVLMGNNQHYEMTDSVKLNKILPDLTDRIKLLLTGYQPNQVVEMQTLPYCESTSVTASESEQEISCVSWNCERVVNWIRMMSLKTDIEGKTREEGVNGNTLAELQHWQIGSPDFFLRFCESSLGMHDPMDILVFSRELRQLK